MFYTPDALRRGGRFYQCWVADAWPLRFATMSERQIIAINIPQICDELLEVILTESGAPRRRFSLRLSIRLIRGLARIYRRQCNVVLKDLCMIDAKIMRIINQRELERHRRARPGAVRPSARPALRLAPTVTQPDEQAKEGEAGEAGRAFVVDEQSITLREDPLPLPAPRALDGFGEEPADQLLRDIETMLGPERGELVDDASLALAPTPAPSRSTRLTAPPAELVLSEVTGPGDAALTLDVTGALDRDMTALHVPEAPVPTPASPTVPVQAPPVRTSIAPQPPCDPAESMELLELEHVEGGAPPRRRIRRLAVDNVTEFNKQQMREQIQDLRIEAMDSCAVIEPGQWVNAEKILLQSARGWHAHVPGVSHVVVHLFSRNLAPLRAPSERMFGRGARETAPPTAEIVAPAPVEMVALPPEVLVVPPLAPLLWEQPIEEAVVPPPECEVSQRPARDEPQELNEVTSAPPPMDTEAAVAAQIKRSPVPPHPSPVVARKRRRTIEEENTAARTIEEMSGEIRQQSAVPVVERASLSQMLETSGLRNSEHERQQHAQRERDSRTSNSSETPLGSLDRTLVSLGDPVPPSESTVFLRENWGPEGTILKIVGALRAGQRPLTVERLVSLGPERPADVGRAAVVAHCFGSILKLKQARFLKVMKNPETLEVVDMDYGDKIKIN